MGDDDDEDDGRREARRASTLKEMMDCKMIIKADRRELTGERKREKEREPSRKSPEHIFTWAFNFFAAIFFQFAFLDSS